jgi:hypothetical protein
MEGAELSHLMVNDQDAFRAASPRPRQARHRPPPIRAHPGPGADPAARSATSSTVCASASSISSSCLGWHWPAFNVADSAISIGAVILILEGFIRREKRPDAAP